MFVYTKLFITNLSVFVSSNNELDQQAPCTRCQDALLLPNAILYDYGYGVGSICSAVYKLYFLYKIVGLLQKWQSL